MTSGTTRVDRLQLVALSKSAFLAAAAGANAHVQSTASDCWFNVLPIFHVGGLSIYARAYLSGATVVDERDQKWHPVNFTKSIAAAQATLTSLVPTQISDLVAAQCEGPKSLRAVIVGGGALAPDLYQRARALHWPCLPSFGMTECCSQVATAPLESLQALTAPMLKALSHVQLRTDGDCLSVKSPACLSGVAVIEHDEVFFEDPKVDGWFRTQDRVVIDQGGFVRPLGRRDDQIKIAGELVDVSAIEGRLRSVFQMAFSSGDICVLGFKDPRREHTLTAVTTERSFQAVDRLIMEFNTSVLPQERIQTVYFVPNLPRTELGKIKRGELRKQLENIE
jgi:O-succinylbenzoic acid--CoA ligase